jgi:hypothetical protein
MYCNILYLLKKKGLGWIEREEGGGGGGGGGEKCLSRQP